MEDLEPCYPNTRLMMGLGEQGGRNNAALPAFQVG